MRRLLATAAAIALVATGAVASTAHADRLPVGALKWGPCAEASLQAHKAECGFVTVPMDYAKPGGETIQGHGLIPTLGVDDPDLDFDQPRPTTDPILDAAVERIGKKKAA